MLTTKFVPLPISTSTSKSSTMGTAGGGVVLLCSGVVVCVDVVLLCSGVVVCVDVVLLCSGVVVVSGGIGGLGCSPSLRCCCVQKLFSFPQVVVVSQFLSGVVVGQKDLLLFVLFSFPQVLLLSQGVQ